MEVFTLKLLFLFFPGIISLFIIETLTEYNSKNNFYQVVYTFTLGVISYFILYFIKLIPNSICKIFCGSSCSIDKPHILSSIFDASGILCYKEIVSATFIAIILGFLITYVIQNGLFHKFANKFNISNKFSSSSVWGHILNTKKLDTWVVVRDIKNDLMYEGWINAFSDSFDKNELYLSDVNVYKNISGKLLYHIDGLYITRNPNELTIEYPNITEG